MKIEKYFSPLLFTRNANIAQTFSRYRIVKYKTGTEQMAHKYWLRAKLPNYQNTNPILTMNIERFKSTLYFLCEERLHFLCKIIIHINNTS